MVHPIELPGGYWIEPYTTERRVLDGRVAAGVLEQRYGREAALEAMDLKVSLDALKKVVSKYKQANERLETKKGDGVVDKVLKQIEQLGGVATNASQQCKPHKRRGGSK
jgi:hypothetical protein